MTPSKRLHFSIIAFSILMLCSCGEEEVIDFTGEYRSTALTFTECDDTTTLQDYVWEADEKNRFCATVEDTEECFRLIIYINADGTYERIFIDEVINGAFNFSSPDKTEGTYTPIGSELELCPTDGSSGCYIMTLDASRSNLLWAVQGESCVRTYTILKQ